MNITHKHAEQLMAEALYGELDIRHQAQFDTHLATCDTCPALYSKLQATLVIADKRELEYADDESMKGFWDRLEPQLIAPKRESFWSSLPDRLELFDWTTRPAVAAAAGIVLVAVGIFIGRIDPNNVNGMSSPQAAALIDPAITDDFNEKFVNYLDRTKMVLMGVDNYESAEDSADYDLPLHQTVSRALVTQGRELRRHAGASSNENLGLLIDDIERILMQLANSETTDMEMTIQIVQDGIEHNSLLFKITLTELGRIKDAPAKVEPKTSSFIASTMVPFDQKENHDG